jgi:hypothetical protein
MLWYRMVWCVFQGWRTCHPLASLKQFQHAWLVHSLPRDLFGGGPLLWLCQLITFMVKHSDLIRVTTVPLIAYIASWVAS